MGRWREILGSTEIDGEGDGEGDGKKAGHRAEKERHNQGGQLRTEICDEIARY